VVFAAGPNGNAAPIARIAGANTRITNSEGLALDVNDNIWITNYGAQTLPANVLELAAGSNGNVAPMRFITGANTRLGASIGLAIDRHDGEIYVCSGGNGYAQGAVQVFAHDADGNAAPVAQLLPGTFPTGIVLPN
jgi:hypothetical protein